MQDKRYKLCGIANSIVDVLVELSNDQFASLALEAGSMTLVTPDQQREIFTRLGKITPQLVSGGSVANSMIAFAQLGGKGALISSLGDDKYGLHYQSELQNFKIEYRNPLQVGKPTGVCLIMVTPDGSRTMRTCLGANLLFDQSMIDAELIAQSEWIFIEGYLVSNGDNAVEAVKYAVQLAERSGTKVALTLSDKWVVDLFRPSLEAVLDRADLVICNEHEVAALTGAVDQRESLDILARRVPNVVVTAGERGSAMIIDGVMSTVPAFPCTPRDLTGAGDMFAGAFMYGFLTGKSPVESARGASYLAREVVTKIGARLHSGTREAWEKGLAAA